MFDLCLHLQTKQHYDNDISGQKKQQQKSLVILIPAPLERCCTKTKLFDPLDLKLEVSD